MGLLSLRVNSSESYCRMATCPACCANKRHHAPPCCTPDGLDCRIKKSLFSETSRVLAALLQCVWLLLSWSLVGRHQTAPGLMCRDPRDEKREKENKPLPYFLQIVDIRWVQSDCRITLALTCTTAWHGPTFSDGTCLAPPQPPTKHQVMDCQRS